MRFCVIGAGSGGRAFSAYVSSKGHKVNLYNRSYTRIYEIWKSGGIHAEGKLEGFFPLEMVTQDLGLAVKKADVIMIVTPAFSHKEIAQKMAPYLQDKQIIILNPGRTFGSIEFRREIEKIRSEITIYIGETQTLLFTCRALSGDGVRILKIKESVDFGVFPEEAINIVSEQILDVFPQLNPKENYLDVTLNNIGMLLHPAISLFNAGSIDGGRSMKFYSDGASPRVCQVLENIEFEINEIFERLGLKRFHFCKWAKDCYKIEANNIYKAIQQISAYKTIYAPDNLLTRYFTEDVPTGLVPISSLAKYLNISTPTIDSVIHLSSIMCGKDFSSQGRTLEDLHIEELLLKKLEEVSASEQIKAKDTALKIQWH